MRKLEILSVKQGFSRIGVAFFTITLLALVLQVVAVVCISAMMPHIMETSWFWWSVSLVPMYFVAMPVGVLLLQRVPHAVPAQHKLGIAMFWKCLLICFSMMYLGSMLGQIAMRIVETIFGVYAPDGLTDILENSNMWANFVATVLLAPVVEETLFRKLLIDRVKQFGDMTAIVLSGVIFGLFHGNFYQFFYAAGVGMVFAYVYIRTGRLRYSVVMHMLINFMGAVIAPAMQTYAFAYLDDPLQAWPGILFMGIYLLALFLMTIVGIVLLVSGRRKWILAPGACPLQTHAFRTTALNGGMIAYFILCAAMFAINIMP